MKIAVIGSGIAGLGAAWLLSRQHEVVLFEREARLGGHTHTHDVEQAGRTYAVDSGFIVFNPSRYPLLTRLFDELGVESQPTTMSFSVQDEDSGLEYNAGSYDGLFCQRRNLFKPRFWRMVREIRRFHRHAPALLERTDAGPALGEYLRQGRYSRMFIERYLVPMTSALWSSPPAAIMDFPAKHLVRFMANHRMLQIGGWPEWRVVRGGSSRYVEAVGRHWRAQTRLATPVWSLHRYGDRIEVHSHAGRERFDHAVLACHSDQALRLIDEPTAAEREILGAIAYEHNEIVLHTDARLLPRRRKAWAALNAYIPSADGARCTVSYCMNLLQGIDSPEPFVVTLGRTHDIDPDKVLARMIYHHPVYTEASLAAQQRRDEINGHHRSWFCGAYWGSGFHEDGLRSAVDVAGALGVAWP